MANNNMLTPFNFFSGGELTQAQNKEYCRKLLELNDDTIQKGLLLSETDAKELIDTRNKSLSDYNRIEIGIGVLPKIIEKFSESTFIHQSNYTEILNELVDIFYYIKTEVRDKIRDNDLIDLMWDYFENKCFGSIELMAGRELEILIKYIHGGRTSYILDHNDDYNISDCDPDDEPDMEE